MPRGKFISIEGTEGAGKSTALKFVKEYLQKAKINTTITREPGGPLISEEIRDLVLSPVSFDEMIPETELLLMFAARAQHLHQIILPELDAGKWVISDRFIDASYAYQGAGRGMDEKKIALLDQWIVGDHYPDLTILLDVSPEIGKDRAEKRGNERDRIEQEKIDFFTRVRNSYLERAQNDNKRIKIIDATEPLYTVQNQLGDLLDEFIAGNT